MQALSISVVFFFFYLYWAYGLAFGSYLRLEEIRDSNSGELYTGGRVIRIMFCIILGSFDMGSAIPHFKSIAGSRKSATLIYQVLNRVGEKNDEGPA